jgi:hypothetical protein
MLMTRIKPKVIARPSAINNKIEPRLTELKTLERKASLVIVFNYELGCPLGIVVRLQRFWVFGFAVFAKPRKGRRKRVVKSTRGEEDEV